MAGNELYDTITEIMGILFDREETQIRNRELSLLPRHASLGGSKDGFRHMGVVYTQLATSVRKQGTYDRVHASLVPELDTILAERKVIQSDREWIKQALFLVLQDARSAQDLRDALPNCLTALLPQCARLARTRGEAFTLSDNPRAFSQYMRLKDKIEFYVAARFLY